MESTLLNTKIEIICSHVDITYIDLLQVDGQPLYTVKCEDCGEYGTIELIEGDNTFSMTKEDIEGLK